MTTFDFGGGPVLAERRGGGLRNTATVNESAFVGLNAQVSGDFNLSGNST